MNALVLLFDFVDDALQVLLLGNVALQTENTIPDPSASTLPCVRQAPADMVRDVGNTGT